MGFIRTNYKLKLKQTVPKLRQYCRLVIFSDRALKDNLNCPPWTQGNPARAVFSF